MGCFSAADDCSPGETLTCTCLSGLSGERQCDSRGRLGDCQCAEDPKDGGGSDGGSDGGGTPDGGGDGGSGCSPGFTACSGQCVDTQKDPRGCGDCNTKCVLGDICSAGQCQPGGDCRNGQCGGVTYCDSSTGLCLPGCSDNSHCPRGEYCDLGSHACACAPGSDRCGASCVDLQRDVSNCGVCSRTCPPASSCLNAACTCQAALSDCSGVCVDLDADPANCGGCARLCDPSASCIAGGCVCPGGLSDCSGVCVDLDADPANCGACGRRCAVGESCELGSCKAPPDCRVTPCVGLSYCDRNTGACLPGCDADAQCSASEVCDLPSHACVCPGGSLRCGGVCVDPLFDPNNCGSCTQACPPGQSCTQGKCIDPALACASYSAGNRLSTCKQASDCSGSTECSSTLLASFCVDETPCAGSPAGPCCGVGEFCGGASSFFGAPVGQFCCVPGETLADGIIPTTCVDVGLTLGCVSDSDCPKAWGIAHCNKAMNPVQCTECTQDSHCQSAGAGRCDLRAGSCVECLSSNDCSGATPLCDLGSHQCTGCRSDRDCGGATPACDTGIGKCVACTSDANCRSPLPACDTKAQKCVACTADRHCSAPTGVCDTATMSCAECVKDADCSSALPVCAGGSCALCPTGTSCQTLQDGRRACYGTPTLPFSCKADTDCLLFGFNYICGGPSGKNAYCSLPCP